MVCNPSARRGRVRIKARPETRDPIGAVSPVAGVPSDSIPALLSYCGYEPWRSCVLLLTELGVCGSIEQSVDFTGIAETHFHDPVLKGILVDEFGFILESLVDLDYLAANG